MTFAAVSSAITSAAADAGVDPGLVRAIAHVETGGSYKPTLTSPKGAMGLMQLMPGTAEQLGVSDPYDPAQSSRGGAQYLSYLYKRFGAWPQAIAAYNWGEGMVGGNEKRSPSLDPASWPKGVQTYVNKVLDLWQQFSPSEPMPVVPQLVASRTPTRSSGTGLVLLGLGAAAGIGIVLSRKG